jgi:hypothetical protein
MDFIVSFIHILAEEFKKLYLNGYTNILQPGGGSGKKRSDPIDVKALPAEVDWRNEARGHT